LDVEKTVKPTSFDNLKKTILEMAKQFPHRRIVLTYKTEGEETHIEVHPVTGAA
jgi:hypothetical protein